MTSAMPGSSTPHGAEEPGAEEQGRAFHFTDKRKVTPEGETRDPEMSSDPLAGLEFPPSTEAAEDAALLAAKAEAAEHLDALQRERASFTNFRNRTLRDQEASRVRGVEDVLTALLPVLDDVDRARQAGELAGPFEAISEKLDGALARFGIERYGVVGDEFDPALHDALMHSVDADADATAINIVIEPGYRIGERVIRPARVSVTGPES